MEWLPALRVDKRDLIPPGFHEELRERIEGIDNVEELLDGASKLDGAVRVLQRKGIETKEIGKSLAWVELRVGILLGKPPGKGVGGGRAKKLSVAPDSLSRHQRAEFRRMAWPEEHRAIVAETIRAGQWRRAQRLRAIADHDNGKRSKNQLRGRFRLTCKGDPIACDALITDPPYGILKEDWEPSKLESSTRAWAKRWAQCRADFIVTFWSQQWLWEGRRWFDESLSGYTFQQMLIWCYPNNKSPQSRMGFKQTWEPILFYRRADSQKEILIERNNWGRPFTDFDHAVAAVPQSNFVGPDCKTHPAQKPLDVMLWLVNALSRPEELVCDPFCGSGTTGIAAIKLGRRFHGIETSKRYLAEAKKRIACYGAEPL